MADKPPNEPHVLDQAGLAAGLPPSAERDRPSSPVPTGNAWVRGHGAMEGPTGWGSRFGRPGFAAEGNPPRPIRTNPLLDVAAPEPDLTAERAAPLTDDSEPGEPTDAWDRPYGDASWGGPEAVPAPSEARGREPRGPKG